MRGLSSLLLLSIVLSSISSCKKDSKSSSNPVVSTLESSTTGGVTQATYVPSNSAQRVVVSDPDALTNGVELTIAPGTFTDSTQIFVEEGGSPKDAVVSALSVSEAPDLVSTPIVIRSSDTSVIPAQPLALTLPLLPTLSLSDSKKFVVLYVAWAADGIKAGIISDVKAEGLKINFSAKYFGSYQVAKIQTVPTTTEVATSATVTTANELKTPQSLYIAANVDEVAGYFKDGVFVGLHSKEEGKGDAGGLMISKDNKLVLFGGKPNPAGGYLPGYWKDKEWVELPFPEGQTTCKAIRGVELGGSVHTIGYCGMAYTATYWRGSEIVPLAKRGTGSYEPNVTEISVNKAGKIVISGRQDLPLENGGREYYPGFWVDGTWQDLPLADESTRLQWEIIGGYYLNSAGKEVLYAYQATQSSSKRFFFEDGIPTETSYLVEDYVIAPDGKVIAGAYQGTSFGFLEGNAYTEIVSVQGSNNGLGHIAVAKNGEKAFTMNEYDMAAMASVYKYYRDGAWTTLAAETEAIEDAIFF